MADNSLPQAVPDNTETSPASRPSSFLQANAVGGPKACSTSRLARCETNPRRYARHRFARNFQQDSPTWANNWTSRQNTHLRLIRKSVIRARGESVCSGVPSLKGRSPACNRLEILQEALEHPECLLVNLDPADDQVLGFQVIGGAGCLAERVSILENNLMALNEVGNVILGRG